jgi:hypothetical protein
MVKYLEYKKEKLPVRLSYRALKVLKGKDLSKLTDGGGGFDDDLFEDLLWAGLRSGHKADEKELQVKKEDMEDVLDECFFEFVKLIPLFFARAKETKEVGNEQPDQVTLPSGKENPNPEIGIV